MQFLPENLKKTVEHMRLIGSDTQHVEVKAAEHGLPDSVASTISAFANRSGGTIILGLDERTNFSPVPGFNAKRIADALQRLGNDFTPPCRLSVERYPFEDHEIVVAVVPATPLGERPCFITKKGLHNGSFIRTGDGDKRLTDYEIDRLREFHHQPAFDREPVPEASLADLDESILEAIVERNREITPRVFGKMQANEILQKLGALAVVDGCPGRYVPTLAGLLVAGIYPQEFFPRLNITYTVYTGTTKFQVEDQPLRYQSGMPINGSIPEMLLTALGQLMRDMRKGALIEGALRREVTDYPILACREAIINALQHRDYSPDGRGSQVQINLFADRLEILNPGGLYGAASLSSLPQGISATRNTRLSQLLEFAPYDDGKSARGYVIENRGTGLQQIEHELHAALMPPPEIQDFVSAFKITFHKRHLSDNEKDGNPWDSFEAALINALKQQGAMSVLDIMESSGLSRNSVSAHLRSLRDKGIIEPTERPKSPKQRYRLVRSD